MVRCGTQDRPILLHQIHCSGCTWSSNTAMVVISMLWWAAPTACTGGGGEERQRILVRKSLGKLSFRGPWVKKDFNELDASLCQTEGSGISGGHLYAFLPASEATERYKHMLPVLYILKQCDSKSSVWFLIRAAKRFFFEGGLSRLGIRSALG